MCLVWILLQKLKEFKDLLVDNPKPSWELVVKVANILQINMYLLCKILDCQFWVGYEFSILYLV